jgi:hypothetical protein
MSIVTVPVPPRQVTLNSIGAGNRNKGAGSPRSTNWVHTVTEGTNRRLYVSVAVSHDNWLNSYSSLTAVSSIDGSLTMVGTSNFFGNSSGNRQGSVSLFELVNPSIGAHTITITVSASQWLVMIGGNSICFNGAGGRDTPVTQTQTTTNAALNLSVTSPFGDATLVVTAFSALPTFSSAPTPWYSVGDSTLGDADYLVNLHRFGDATNFNFATSSSAHKLGAIGINITKA